MPPAAVAALYPGGEPQPEEGFMVGLDQSFVWDDNVFRLPDDAAPVGGGPRGDHVKRTTLDLGFNHTYSLQHIVADLQFVHRSFDEHQDLDSTTRSGSLRWDWAVGKRWSGTAFVQQREAPRSFEDEVLARRVLSVNTLRRAHLDADYWWHSNWSTLVGVERTRSTFSDARSAGSEYNETAVEAGLGYRPRSGNRLDLVARHADGRYPNRSVSAFIDTGYTQDDLRLRGNWLITGASRLSGYVGLTDRNYDHVSRLDFSGPTGRLVYDWTPTGKLAFRVAARREIGSEYEVLDNFVLNRGLALQATWAATAKIAVQANGEWLRRDYGKTAGTTIDQARTQAYGLAVTYTPLRPVALTLSARHAERSAAGRDFDYSADIVGADLKIAF